MEEKRSYYPNVKQAIVLTLVCILLQFLYGGLIGFVYGFRAGLTGEEYIFDPANNTLQYIIVYILGSVIVLGGLSYYITRKKDISLSAIKGNSGKEGILYLYVLLLMAGLTIIVSEVSNLFELFVAKSDFFTGVMEGLLGQNIILVFIVMCVVAPVFEEILFRGIILRGLLKNIKPWPAILVSSLLFAIFHLNIWQGISSFLFGIFMGWVLYRTGSLYLVIFSHFVINFMAFLASQNVINVPGYTYPSETGFQPLWFNLIGLILVIAGIALIKQKSDNNIEINTTVLDQ